MNARGRCINYWLTKYSQRQRVLSGWPEGEILFDEKSVNSGVEFVKVQRTQEVRPTERLKIHIQNSVILADRILTRI